MRILDRVCFVLSVSACETDSLLLGHSHFLIALIPINNFVLNNNKPNKYHVQKHCYFPMSSEKNWVV